jgi:Fe2+ transport system protein FeoA
MTRGTGVRLLNRNREGTVIIMVRGSRLALGKGITGSILVREA